MLNQGLVFSMDNLEGSIADKETELVTLISKITQLQMLLQAEEDKLFECVNVKNCLLNLQSSSLS